MGQEGQSGRAGAKRRPFLIYLLALKSVGVKMNATNPTLRQAQG